MKFLGNYRSWVDPVWRDLVLNSIGQARPRDWPPINAVESAEYHRYKKAGYDLNAVHWWVYEEKDLKLQINHLGVPVRYIGGLQNFIPGSLCPCIQILTHTTKNVKDIGFLYRITSPDIYSYTKII